MLSRPPIVQVEGKLLTSQQEQTGIVHTHLAVAGRDLHVYDTWLGIRGEDTQRQISETVAFIGDHSPAVLGGAFNTEQGSRVYAATNDAGFDFAAFGVSAASPHVQARAPAPHTDSAWLRGWSTNAPTTNHKMVVVRFTQPLAFPALAISVNLHPHRRASQIGFDSPASRGTMCPHESQSARYPR